MEGTLKRSLAVLCVSFLAGCYPATSNIGESCSRDCVMGRCIDLVCKREGPGCTSDSECNGDSFGNKCQLICGCTSNAHCSNSRSASGTQQPYCSSTDGGFSYCSSVRP